VLLAGQSYGQRYNQGTGYKARDTGMKGGVLVNLDQHFIIIYIKTGSVEKNIGKFNQLIAA
jgi:hypothetical protein